MCSTLDLQVQGRFAGRKDAPGLPTVMDPRYGVAFVRGSVFGCCAVDNAAQTSAPGSALGSHSAHLDAEGGILPFHASPPGLDALRADWVRGCLAATMFRYLESAGIRPVLPCPGNTAGSHFA